MKNSPIYLVWVCVMILSIAPTFGQQKHYLVVDKSGGGDFTDIQSAIYSVRDFYESPVQIFIKNGTYHEKVLIPTWKPFIHLVGESKDSTIIDFDDYSGLARSDSFRKIDKISTYNSYTMLVQSNEVKIENLTISNSAGPVGQAVALHLEGNHIQVINCVISGWQDTFFLGKEGTLNYIKDCTISGSTDFIFGAATAFFENCDIVSVRDSYITAASTTSRTPIGFVFYQCQLRPKDDSVKKVFLGRPWRPYAKTYFIDCEFGAHIVAEGWHAWNTDVMFPDKTKTVDYREYVNHGPGATHLQERPDWVTTYKKYKNQFSQKKVLGDWWTSIQKSNAGM